MLRPYLFEELCFDEFVDEFVDDNFDEDQKFLSDGNSNGHQNIKDIQLVDNTWKATFVSLPDGWSSNYTRNDNENSDNETNNDNEKDIEGISSINSNPSFLQNKEGEILYPKSWFFSEGTDQKTSGVEQTSQDYSTPNISSCFANNANSYKYSTVTIPDGWKRFKHDGYVYKDTGKAVTCDINANNKKKNLVDGRQVVRSSYYIKLNSYVYKEDYDKGYQPGYFRTVPSGTTIYSNDNFIFKYQDESGKEHDVISRYYVSVLNNQKKRGYKKQLQEETSQQPGEGKEKKTQQNEHTENKGTFEEINTEEKKENQKKRKRTDDSITNISLFAAQPSSSQPPNSIRTLSDKYSHLAKQKTDYVCSDTGEPISGVVKKISRKSYIWNGDKDVLVQSGPYFYHLHTYIYKEDYEKGIVPSCCRKVPPDTVIDPKENFSKVFKYKDVEGQEHDVISIVTAQTMDKQKSDRHKKITSAEYNAQQESEQYKKQRRK